jgi:class 3 adenylate cyclase
VTKTRYARNGSVHIAYQVFGEGDRDLILINSWLAAIEQLWEEPRLERMFTRLGSFMRVILFDRRGTGMSDRLPPAPLEEQMDDVIAVLDAAGADRPAVFAETEGTALACLLAATRPERVSSLALWSPMPRFTQTDDYPWGFTEEQRADWIEGIYWHWGQGTSAEVMAPSAAGDQEFARWVGRLERLTASPGAVRPMLRQVGEHDVRAVLPLIRVPTLVLRRTENRYVDARHTAYVCEQIPDATLVEVPGRDQLLFIGDTEPIIEQLQEFVGAAPPRADAQRVLATVLFTDIVGSTEHAARMGDSEWARVLADHRGLVRAELARHDGREVKTMGDGFLAVFDGPARAIRAGLAIAQGSDGQGLQVRAGVHTGECELKGDDVDGLAVHIAARVLDRAGPGEVLVSRTVGDLVAGSGLGFSSRGAHELKGLPGSWELLAAAA